MLERLIGVMLGYLLCYFLQFLKKRNEPTLYMWQGEDGYWRVSTKPQNKGANHEQR